MTELILYWSLMIGSYVVASKVRDKGEFKWVDTLLNFTIYFLVFLMGLRMGANEEVTSSLGTIGIQSLIACVFALAGSMLAVFVVRKALGFNRRAELVGEGVSGEASAKQSETKKKKPQEGGTDSKESLKVTVLILALTAIGMYLGYAAVGHVFKTYESFDSISGTALTVGLCVLMVLVGFNLGYAGTIVSNLKKVGLKVIWIPLAATAGSVLFGFLYGLVSPVTPVEGMAVAAGFGWYTLAPGIMTSSGHVVAGAICFMSNVIRETIGIIGIPLIADKIGYLESTAVPGVAAMDICLPIVERSTNGLTTVYSFVTGAIMAITVAVLVPVLMGI